MRINWEEFEENLQELHEELNISSSSHEAFVEEFTNAVNELIEDNGLSTDEYERAINLARRYGYQVAADDNDEDALED